jgi:hypothetical protein
MKKEQRSPGCHAIAARDLCRVRDDLVDAMTGEEAEPMVVDRNMERGLDSEDLVVTAGPAAMRARYPHSFNSSSKDNS